MQALTNKGTLFEFQSTHPRGVRPGSMVLQPESQRFQSTHPRGVRRQMMHADSERREFQSTHPRGVRRIGISYQTQNFLFQSTHPRGVRLIASIFLSNGREVSIHAPARGATIGSYPYF